VRCASSATPPTLAIDAVLQRQVVDAFVRSGVRSTASRATARSPAGYIAAVAWAVGAAPPTNRATP
jgi:hypothetical protein